MRGDCRLQGGPTASETAIALIGLPARPHATWMRLWGGGRGSPRDFGAVWRCLDGNLSDFEAILSDFQAIWGDLRCSMQVPHNKRGGVGRAGRIKG